MRTIKLLHRIAVDWTADMFGLRGPSARARHEAARDRAYGRARRLPEALPRPRAVRVLPGWQGRIGGLAGRGPAGGTAAASAEGQVRP
jgi:hypothetical protein